MPIKPVVDFILSSLVAGGMLPDKGECGDTLFLVVAFEKISTNLNQHRQDERHDVGLDGYAQGLVKVGMRPVVMPQPMHGHPQALKGCYETASVTDLFVDGQTLVV